MSRRKKIIGAVLLLCLAVVIFHKSILLCGCRFYLNKLQRGPGTTVVSYDTLQWEGSAIVLRGLSVKNVAQELTVDSVEVEWHFDFKRLCLCPEINVVHPQFSILTLNGSSQDTAAFLYQSPRFQPHLAVSNGVLQFPDSRFYFSLSPEETGEVLTLSHQPDLSFLPLLKAHLSYEDQALHAVFELSETDLTRSAPLLTFLAPSLGNPSLFGEMTIEGEVVFDLKEGIKEVTFQGDAHHLQFTKNQGEIQLDCEQLSCSFFYAPQDKSVSLWDTLGASCLVKEGQLVFSSGWSLQGLNGMLTVKPGEEIESSFQGDLFHGDRSISWGMQASGPIVEGAWQPSFCHMEGEGIVADGYLVEQGVEIHLQGDAQPLLQFAFPSFSSELKKSFNFDLKVALEKEKESVTCALTGVIAEDLVEASSVFSLSPFKWLDLFAGKPPVLQFKEATCQVPELHLKPYTSFLKTVFPLFSFEGVLHCEAVSSSQLLQMTLQLEDLVIDHALATFHIPSNSEKSIQLAYEWKTGRYSVEIPFSNSSLASHQIPVALEQLSGELKLTPEWLEIASFEAVCEGITLQGAVKADLVKEKLLTLSTSKIDGSVSQIHSLLSRFSTVPQAPITGVFHSGVKGLVLTLPLHTDSLEPYWVLKGTFSELTFPMNSQTFVREGRCEVTFDSKQNQLLLEKGEGRWDLVDGTSLSIQTKRLVTDFSSVDFSVKVVEGKKEFVQLEGKIHSSGSGWELTLDPKLTHVVGIGLNMHECRFSQALELIAFDMKPLLKAQEIYPLANFLKNTGVLTSTTDLKPLSTLALQGKLQLHLFSEAVSKEITLSASSTDLKVQGQSYSPFTLSARESQGVWTIDRLQTGFLSLSGVLTLDINGFTLPQFEATWKNTTGKGSGYFKTNTKQFHCSLESVKADLSTFTTPTSPFKGSVIAGARLVADFSDLSSSFHLSGEANLLVDLQSPLPISAQNRKLIRFSYHPQEGLVAEGIDLQLKQRMNGVYLADLKSGKLLLPKEGYLSLQGLQLTLTPGFADYALTSNWLPKSLSSFEWEGNQQASGDFQLTPANIAFQGTLSPGRYAWDGKLLTFEQIQLGYDKNKLYVRTKTHIEEQPLWSSLQLDIDREIYGTLKLLDHPKAEGLKITFRSQVEGWMIEGAQGSFYGLDCQLKTQLKRKLAGASSLTGAIKIDLSRLTLLLPDAVQKGLHPLKLGSGYEWEGDLVIWQDAKKGFVSNGVLKGKEFEALGYRFEQLQASIDANSEKITLSQLKIEESGGLIGMKKLELSKQQDKWLLHIPQIEVRHLQPSLMRKIGVEQGGVKPFVIQNFTLAEIRGELGNLSTLQGNGYLTFVNQFKKETSILDLPLEIIKKIGLDLGLLTPVEGELKIELRGDKLYLLSLDHSYSEAKRSEFYLAPSKHLSYIDLKGGVHIDLKMRQDVMLKMIEPFTLTIRGTLDKPRYGLQF